MSEEGSDERDIPAELNEKTVEQRVVRARIRRGQPHFQDGDAREAVVLSATPSRILYEQYPRRFVAEEGVRAEKLAADVRKMNEEYQNNVRFNRGQQNQAEAEVQTEEKACFDKGVCGGEVKYRDAVSEANYLDICSVNQGDEMNATQVAGGAGGAAGGDQQAEDQKQNQHRSGEDKEKDFDDEGSVYTGKGDEDGLSDAGTAYTAGTQRTQTKSIGSVGSSLRDPGQENARAQQKIASGQQRLFQSKQFVQDLLLAELLALQQPLFAQLQLFRGSDIQLQPHTNYKQLVRDEFTTNNPRVPLQVKLLFTYKHKLLTGCKAVALDFCPTDERLLLVGYATSKFGALAIWHPENPFTPKIIVFVRQEVTCAKWYPVGKSVCAAGFSDGSVALFDLREGSIQLDQQGFAVPILVSSNVTGKHTSKVWDIQWASGDVSAAAPAGGAGGDANKQEEAAGQQQQQQQSLPVEFDTLVSVATDGRVVERSVKRSFEHRDILTLTNVQPHPVALVQNQKNSRMTIIRKLSAGLSLDFLDSATYLTGGDDALIRRASRSYAEQTLQIYQGHLSSIYKVRVNPSAPRYFLSASADRTCRVWDAQESTPQVTLRTSAEEHIYAAEWARFRASVFICGARNGAVEVWDLNENMVRPQIVIQKLRLREDEDGNAQEEAVPVRAISCSPKLPVFSVGYENGWVQIYRIQGLENGFILKNIDPEGYAQVEEERMAAVLNSQKTKEE